MSFLFPKKKKEKELNICIFWEKQKIKANNKGAIELIFLYCKWLSFQVRDAASKLFELKKRSLFKIVILVLFSSSSYSSSEKNNITTFWFFLIVILELALFCV